jgi:valyl-tRNA synthetase
MPHLTEELWSQFGFGKGSIQFKRLPEKSQMGTDDKRRIAVGAIYQTVQAGRNLRAEARVPSNQKAKFALRSIRTDLSREKETIARLLNASELVIDPKFAGEAGMPMATAALGELILVVQVDSAGEGERLDKEIARVEEELRTVESKLSNKSFVDRAPAAVVEEHRQRQTNFAEQLQKLKQARDKL